MRIGQLIFVIVVAWWLMQWLPLPKPSPVDPRPKPGPVDPVDPSPVDPDFSKYSDVIYREIMQIKSRGRKAECTQLSGDVQSIISGIDSGAISTNQAVVDELVAAFSRLPRAWHSHVRKIADKVFKPLTDDHTLDSPQRWRALLAACKPGIDRAAADSVGVSDQEIDE